MSKRKRIAALEGRVSDLEVLLDAQNTELDKLAERSRELYERMISELKDRILTQNAELNAREEEIGGLRNMLAMRDARIRELSDRDLSRKEQAVGLSTAQLVNEWMNGEEGSNE